MSKNNFGIYSTKWLCVTALLTALVVILGYVPAIPLLSGKIYWCDFAVYTAAYLLDPVAAAIVGGIGSSFFDLFGINGTAYNALPSLIIHGAQGFTAALAFRLLVRFFKKNGTQKKEILLAVLAAIPPALIVIFGYFIKRIVWEGVPLDVALLKMPANVVQEIVGITVSVLVCFVMRLRTSLARAHLLPDYSFLEKKGN